MSNQSEAKQAQGYCAKGPTCATCAHFTSKFVQISWLVESNEDRIAQGFEPLYDLALRENQKETNMRCGLGGFAVKKTACCSVWEGKA